MSGTDHVNQGAIESELQKKERYTRAFRKALPDFYQTLLKHGQWFTHHYTRRGLLFSRREQFEAVPLLRFDSVGGCYTTGEHYIAKDGRYLKNTGSPSRPEYEEIGEQELAEGMYRSLDWDNGHGSVSGDSEYDKALLALREAMDADDADAAAFRYCMLVLRYQYR